MELGFHVPIFDIDGGTAAIAGELARVGAAAENAGASWLSFMDHFFQIEPTGLPAESNMLEGYTTLGFMAAHTTTIELGLLVTGVTYRHPGLLAKIVTTLDVLSTARRFSSEVAARSGRCGWWLATATPATCSPPARTRWRINSTYCAGTATTPVPITTGSAKPYWAAARIRTLSTISYGIWPATPTSASIPRW